MAVTYMVLPLLPGQKVARVMAINAGPALPVSSHGIMLVTGGDTAVDVDDTHPFPVRVKATDVGSAVDADNAAIITLNTKLLRDGATDVTPKHAIIAAAATGANSIVAAVSGKRIKVLAYNFTSNGAVNAKFQSGSTDLTGLTYMPAAGQGKVANFNPAGWFDPTAVNTALNLNLSTNIAVGGELTYIEIA